MGVAIKAPFKIHTTVTIETIVHKLLSLSEVRDDIYNKTMAYYYKFVCDRAREEIKRITCGRIQWWVLKMKNKNYSCEQYWLILFCWFFSPIFVQNILHIQFSSTQLIFGFMVPYWLFVLATIVYERYNLFSYLHRYYPYEYKKLKRLSIGTIEDRIEYLDFLDNFYPEGDKEWVMIQSNLKKHMHFVIVSFFSVGGFALLYFNLLVVD